MPSTQTSIIDGLSTSVAVKAPCVDVITTDNPLTGLQGYVDGDRLLVIGQTNQVENGIYLASSSQWSRAPDADGNRDLRQGTRILVRSPNTSGVEYELTSSNPIVIGTSALTFERRYGANAVYDQTQAESNAGIPLYNEAYDPTHIIALRYGIFPNDQSLASTNTAILKALLDPTVDGPRGKLIFPSITGNDTYYFDDFIEVRPGIHIDANHCKLHFSKTLSSADNFKACFMAIRDFTLENFHIIVDVTGSATNGGAAFRLGSRTGYAFGNYSEGIFDKDDLTSQGLQPMGNMHVRNGTITTNNPYANVVAASFGIGGLVNCSVTDVTFIGDGNSGPGTGFYYEPGFASKNGQPNTVAGHPHWESSHAHNLVLRNIVSKNMNEDTDNFTVSLVEPYNAIIENVKAIGGYGAVQVRVGEFHFYRPWVGVDTAGGGACVSLRNIVAENIVGVGLALSGAHDVSAGYLADANMSAAGLPALTLSQKVDLIKFSLDGFAVTGDATGSGLVINAPATVKNGRMRNCFNGINILGDCPTTIIENCDVLDSVSVGIRANTAASIFSNRKKILRISGGKVCGSDSAAGISLDWVLSAKIEGVQLGYNSARDDDNEDTQTAGVAVSSDAEGVECDGCYVTTSGGASAYVLAGSGDRGCNVRNARGTVTYTGAWLREGTAIASSTQIASVTDVINTANKYLGKRVLDTSNTRYLIATGAASTSAWNLCDGSTSVTPST